MNKANCLNTKQYQLVISLALLSLLGACASNMGKVAHKERTAVQRVAFKTSDLKQSPEKTMLVGRTFLFDNRQLGERASARIDVILNPVSKTSTQWYDEVCRAGNVLEGKIDPAYRQALHTTRTNEYGQFAFADVPVGEYYLAARLYWFDSEPFSGPVQYGGLLAKKIKLTNTTNTLDLTEADRCSPYFH